MKRIKEMISNYGKWNPSVYATILLLMTPFVICIFLGFQIDNDFWFLVNTGKTIIKEGFISIEPFTIHSGLAFFPQQWLTDILFYFIYNNFGIKGMYYLVLLSNGLIVFIFYKICCLICNNKNKAVLISAFTDMFLYVTGILTTRPQLFDVIIFSLELLLLESYIKKEKNTYLVFIPLLSIILINSHASMWMMLFVLMIPYYVENFILKLQKKKNFKIKPLIIITCVSLLCGFINPYGIEAIKYLFNSYGNKQINATVFEMQAITITHSVVVYVIIFIFLYSFYCNKGNNKIRYFLLCMGLTYLTLSHYRGILYLTILIPIVWSYNFVKKVNTKKTKANLKDKIAYSIGMIIIVVLLITSVKLSDGVNIKEFADYLDQNATYDIKLYTGYDDGAYMEYRGYKCYIDPRAEVFLKSNNHKEDIFSEYYKLDEYDSDIKAFLDKYQFDYLLIDIKDRTLLRYLMDSSDYEMVLSKETDKKNKIMTFLYKKLDEEKK